MIKNNLKVDITRNILEGKQCDTCKEDVFCTSKSKKLYHTCRKWTERQSFTFNISSYQFNTSARPLKVTWTKETETMLENSFNKIKVDSNGNLTTEMKIDSNGNLITEIQVNEETYNELKQGFSGVSVRYLGDLNE